MKFSAILSRRTALMIAAGSIVLLCCAAMFLPRQGLLATASTRGPQAGRALSHVALATFSSALTTLACAAIVITLVVFVLRNRRRLEAGWALVCLSAVILASAVAGLAALFSTGESAAGVPIALKVLVATAAAAAALALPSLARQAEAFLNPPEVPTDDAGRRITAATADSIVERGAGVEEEGARNLPRMEAFPRSRAELPAYTQALIRDSPFSVIATDAEGTVMAVNPATEALLGYAAGELIDQPMPLYLHGEAELLALASDGAAARGTEVLPHLAASPHGPVREWTYLHKHGHAVPVSLSVFAVRDTDQAVLGYYAVAFDATERKRTEEHIRHLALHDPLTGLPNRSLLQDRLQMAIERSHRSGTTLAVIMIDLDNFKTVNDTYGHEVGDKLLRALAGRLNASVRKSDTVARMGGDEFVVLAPEISDRDSAIRLAGEILGTLCEPVSLEFHLLTATASIGVSMLSPAASDPVTLLKHADVAMYSAKDRGRNNVVFFNTAMQTASERRVQLEQSLKAALDNNQFALNFQPLVRLATGQIAGVEALLRWHPQPGRSVSPDAFIPHAEETGLIVAIGDWVLRNACIQGRAMQNYLGVDFKISVNISARQLERNRLHGAVVKALEASSLPASCLNLEITESVLMLKDTSTLDTLRRIRALGVTIAIDDFGTGYSSLSYLTHFPVDRIKIDRSFVERVTRDPACGAVANAILAMSHSLGLEVVAEGVETPDQLAYLLDQGCDLAQGYYFARPQPLNELLARIEVAASPDGSRAYLSYHDGDGTQASATA
jgi:diguanylate cyclase (GGDEF)-like protein/PAS domain S-box-containing protein